MRFDVESFLALTVALGTVGAVGVAVYTSRDAHAEAAVEEAAEPPAPPLVVAPAAAPTPAPVAVVPAAPPTPVLDAAPEVLDAAPGPQVESMDW